MLRFFERFLEPTAHSPDAPPPVLGTPQALLRFYWHFVRQIPGPLAALFATGFCVAITDALIPVCLGRIVSLVSSTAPEAIWPEAGGQLLLMVALFLVFRPAAHFAQLIVANLMLVPGLTNLVRWQSHWHVVRQGWTFFQNDFAGRIAARVMQTGPALRESVVLSIIGIWYILVFGVIAIGLLSAADWRLCLPIVAWFVLYVIVLGHFLPQMRERSRAMSEMRSVLTGKIVDSYTNILTVKLFARAREEDAFVREAVDEHTETWRAQHRAGRAGWARWALGRRQIDTRASAARVLPAGTRSHPDRRARHRRTDTREPARADRHGHAGHLAAASLDPRQYPLRPARGERGRDR